MDTQRLHKTHRQQKRPAPKQKFAINLASIANESPKFANNAFEAESAKVKKMQNNLQTIDKHFGKQFRKQLTHG